MSFIEVRAESDFPIENLPFGVFTTESNVIIIYSLLKIIKILQNKKLLI